MRKAFLILILTALTCAAAAAQTSRAGNNVTGQYVLHYSNVSARLDVLQLSHGRIKFSLVALLKTGRDSHNGTAEGTVALNRGTAVYEDGDCRISMKFVNGKVVVKEHDVQDCGFGAFVTAQGTYIRKSRKPKFDQ
jgi:hypothetical protein